MKKVIAILYLSFFAAELRAQLILHTGEVSFSVMAPMRRINAVNTEVTGSWDDITGRLRVEVPVAGFLFRNEFIADSFDIATQRRFVGFYMSGDAYPSASYVAKVINMDEVNLRRNGTYQVYTAGMLTINGVSREVSIPGEAVVLAGEVSIKASVRISTADYQVHVPEVIRGAFFQEVEVWVKGVLRR